MEMMNSLIQAIPAHVLSGNTIIIDKWECFHDEEFGIRMESTLVSPVVQDTLRMYMCGSYTCACCKAAHTMDATTFMYLNGETKQLTCPPCILAIPIQMRRNIRPVVVKLDTSTPFIPSPIHTYHDLRPKTPEERAQREQHYKETCEKVAEVHDMVYLQGKSIRDVRSDFLAKRVVRKWRQHVQKRLVSRMFYVLYHGCNMGLDASVVLANNTVKAMF